jgi:DNA-binding NtrC family response regulator
MASILLVEDDEQMRNLLSDILRREGYEVVVAQDGQEAVRLYHQRPTDLIVTDLLMPEKEGLEMIIELHRSHPELRIIAMTGGGDMNPDALLKMASFFGAWRILHKPFSLGAFLHAVDESLQT